MLALALVAAAGCTKAHVADASHVDASYVDAGVDAEPPCAAIAPASPLGRYELEATRLSGTGPASVSLIADWPGGPAPVGSWCETLSVGMGTATFRCGPDHKKIEWEIELRVECDEIVGSGSLRQLDADSATVWEGDYSFAMWLAEE